MVFRSRIGGIYYLNNCYCDSYSFSGSLFTTNNKLYFINNIFCHFKIPNFKSHPYFCHRTNLHPILINFFIFIS
jgi:hypothetical protein